MDSDGAGADIPIGQSEGEDDDGEDNEDRDDEDDQRPSKQARITADAEVTLAGLRMGILNTGGGRISCSSSAASHSYSSRSSSVVSSRSAMSIS